MSVFAGWNAENITTLRRLWAEGHSLAEIGRRMKITKNAVNAKADRLDLPGRPSPIRRKQPDAPPKEIPRAGKITLPSLPSLKGS